MKPEIKERIEKIRNGEVPEGYKKTKVGVIPYEWKLKKLQDVTTKIGDGIHTTPKYDENGDYYFINGNNLSNGEIEIKENTKCINYKEYERYKQDLNESSILLSINGTIGNIAYYNGEDILLGKSAAFLNTNGDNDRKYLYYLLQSSPILAQFINELTGSTIRNLSLKSIRKTKIPSPCLEEQEKIANILSTWDKAIELKEKLIEAKKEQKQGLMQLLLTGKKRLKGFSEEWKEVKLNELLEYEQPNMYIVDDILEYNPKMTPVLTANKSFILGSTTEQEGIYKELPVIIFDDFTTDNKYVDFVFKVKSSAMKILKSKTDNIDLKFVYELMQFIRFPVGEHKRYYISEYQYVKVKVPGFEEQKRISEISKCADAEINLLEQELETLKQQKKGLMQLLLTGIVRVNEL